METLVAVRAMPTLLSIFRSNNRNELSYTKLVVSGTIEEGFYAQGKNVWEKKGLLGDKLIWKLKFDVYHTDIVVYLQDFRTGRIKDTLESPFYVNPGLWLLRPADENEFRIIVCLRWNESRWFLTIHTQLYWQWAWDQSHFQRVSSQEQQNSSYRPLATNPKDTAYDPPMRRRQNVEFRKFIIS